MAKRITIVIDDDINDKLRKLQAKTIQETGNAVSFSRIINAFLGKSLKK